MPLMKALGVDKGTQLSYPSMWPSSEQQGTSNVLARAETDRKEPPTSFRGDVGKNVTPNSRPPKLEKDQFHSTLSPYYNNVRDISSSQGTSRASSPQTSPRLRYTSIDRQKSQPQSPSLPTVAPGALASCKPLQSESALTGFWADLAENKYLNTQEFWLALYFFFNLSLTLYNKVVLVHFPYPYTVTSLHALCGAVGGWSLLAQGLFVQKRLSASDNMSLIMFSVLYAMNIAISNVSLNLVTVPVSLHPILPVHATTDAC